MKRKQGNISIALILAGGFMSVVLLNLLAQSLNMASLVQNFDQYRQEVNLEEGLANIVKNAAYEVLEPKVHGNMTFKEELQSQLAAVHPEATLVEAPDFGELKVFPQNTVESITESYVSISLFEKEYRFRLKMALEAISHWSIVAYSLPVTGIIANECPVGLDSMRAGSELNIHCLSNKDLFSLKCDLKNEISHFHRRDISLNWNLYEYLWSPEHQSNLHQYALPNCLELTLREPQGQPIQGVSYNFETKQVLIDLALIPTDALSLVDPLGWGTITIQDSGGNSQPLVLQVWSRHALNQPKIEFISPNTRPLVFYCPKGHIQAQGTQLKGAFLLGKDCSWSGPTTIKGHVSFYAPSGSLPLNVAPDSLLELNPFLPKTCKVEVQKI